MPNKQEEQFWWNRGPAGPKGDKGDKGDSLSYYKVTYDGSHIQHDGVNVTYSELVEIYNNDAYFLYAEANGLTMIPSLPPMDTDPILEFSCSWIYAGKTTISRLIINNLNQIKYENVELAKNADITRTFELLNDYSVSEDTDSVTISTDSNGNPLKLKQVRFVYLTVPYTSSQNIFADVKLVYKNGTSKYVNLATLSPIQTSQRRGVYDADVLQGMYKNSASVQTSTGSTVTTQTFITTEIDVDHISEIRLRKFTSATRGLVAGEKITVYGVKA